ncbi:MAG: nucleotidyltransferase family protein [Sphingobacteriales bacterium]|nr:nucleotidyltransferase family protein [Sphingobacteriales bacterium]
MKKAMILAAGKGTRLKPFTDTMPKALFPLNGTPILEIVIQRLIKYGFKDIIINVHHFAEKIEEFLQINNNFDINITFSHEENLLETGGGLKKASWFFEKSGYFLVHNVDIISDLNLEEFFTYSVENQSIATLAVSERDSSRYFLFDSEMNLKGWRNTKTGETIIYENSALRPYAFSGIQVLSDSIFQFFPEKDVFSLTELYLTVCGRQQVRGYLHSAGNWMDVGKTVSG